MSLKSGLFHFRLTVSNLSFCDLTLDFAYHVEEYSQLDSRRSIIITSIVLVVAMSMLMTDFTRYYTRRGTKRCKGHFRSELYCIAYTIWLILFPMTFMNKTNMILVISPPIRCPTWWLHLLSDQFVPLLISIKPELANIKNKMVLVHEDSEMLGSEESLVRNTTGNKMKVKLLMNNNTVEVDTPTSKHFIEPIFQATPKISSV